MNVDTFRIFCDVIFHQSFSRGASANNISQSAATQSIHRLEKELGAQLVDRSKRPFALTPEGQVCYEGFREILETYDNIVMRVQSLHIQVGGLIRVAAIYSVGLHDMSKCMRDFMKAFPKAKIRLEFLHPQKVYQAVINSEVDLGVVSYPISSPEINVIPLRSEEMVVVVPPNHSLAKKKSLTIDQLDGTDFVAFDRDLFIRKETDRQFRQRGVRVNVVMEFDNIETIKQAIQVGIGISILPVPTVKEDVDSEKMVAIPLTSPKMSRPIGIIHKHRKVFTGTMLRFVEILSGQQIQPETDAPILDD
ncbi:MAG: LysR family transcriptional regulator [Planctomycetia bacterium]|nr:LysR family transcriptional regulator [Planctomycetia bacterium]